MMWCARARRLDAIRVILRLDACKPTVHGVRLSNIQVRVRLHFGRPKGNPAGFWQKRTQDSDILMVTLKRHRRPRVVLSSSVTTRTIVRDFNVYQDREFFNDISAFGNSALPPDIELEALKTLKHQEYIPDLEKGDVRRPRTRSIEDQTWIKIRRRTTQFCQLDSLAS